MTCRARAAAVVPLIAASLVLALAVVDAQDWRRVSLSSFDMVWQTVQETHYDPNFGGVDWNAVRADLRPKVESAADEAAARDLIREMLARLGLSHFGLISSGLDSESLRGEATVPFDVRVSAEGLLVTHVMAGSSAAVAGLRPGDRLTTIDGDPVQIGAASDAAVPASLRDLGIWRRVMRSLSGSSGSVVNLGWIHPDGVRRAGEVTRVVEPGEVVALGNLPPFRARLGVEDVRSRNGRRYGLIAFNVWMATLAEPFAAAIDRFRAADGLVIDLRGNPGGLADMIRGVAGHILREPAVLGRMRMRTLELEFRANPRRSTADGRRVEPFSGPVALLVDGLTASASECFAGGLQSLGRVRVFGTRTMGQALPAATRSLPNGDVLLYAVGDFVTSTGRRLEGTGVVPDEVVPLFAAELAAGRDARARAINWLDSATSPR